MVILIEIAKELCRMKENGIRGSKYVLYDILN